MPLSEAQAGILRLLAAHRDPESYVAGSTPLNWDAPRLSADVDVFHDREERVAQAALNDSAILAASGFCLEWLRREPGLYAVLATGPLGATRLEWALDSDFRFFPTMPDPLFGYVLHPADLAANKAMAAAGRREPRDVVDLLTIHDRVLPLGAVIWSAVGKSLGFTPEGLIGEIRRLAHYTVADFARVASEPPVDPTLTMLRLRTVLDEAEAFVVQMPTDRVGLLFLEDGKPVQPDPSLLEAYQTHAGQRRGSWPSSPGLTASMLDKHIR